MTYDGQCNIVSDPAIAGLSGEILVVYPNPASDCIKIISDIAIDRVSIADLLGRSFVDNVDDVQAVINLLTIPDGIYVLKVTSRGGQKKICSSSLNPDLLTDVHRKVVYDCLMC